MMQFFRGPRELYNVKAHGAGIYFATDTKEIIQNGLSFLGELPSDLAEAIARIEANEGAIEVLNGTGEGSVSKQISDAIDSFASAMSEDGTINTFKELVDYASEHKEESEQLILDVDNIKNNLIVELQAKDSALESQITELAEDLSLEIDEKINVAFSWINV